LLRSRPTAEPRCRSRVRTSSREEPSAWTMTSTEPEPPRLIWDARSLESFTRASPDVGAALADDERRRASTTVARLRSTGLLRMPPPAAHEIGLAGSDAKYEDRFRIGQLRLL